MDDRTRTINRFLGYDTYQELIEDWENECQLRLIYYNEQGVDQHFGIEDDARGTNIWYDAPGVEHEEFTFKDLEDLLDNYVGPDGKTFRQIMREAEETIPGI